MNGRGRQSAEIVQAFARGSPCEDGGAERWALPHQEQRLDALKRAVGLRCPGLCLVRPMRPQFGVLGSRLQIRLAVRRAAAMAWVRLFFRDVAQSTPAPRRDALCYGARISSALLFLRAYRRRNVRGVCDYRPTPSEFRHGMEAKDSIRQTHLPQHKSRAGCNSGDLDGLEASMQVALYLRAPSMPHLVVI